MKIKIIQEDNGKRLDVFLSEQDKNISRSQWQKRIKLGAVLVKGKEVGVSYRVKEGDEVEITNYSQSRPLRGVDQIINKLQIKNPKLKNIKVVFECKDYIVINKPAGIVTHPDNVNKKGTLVDWLIDKYPDIEKVGDDFTRPGIVHRLDKDVSGLLVVARNFAMFEYLKEQFKKRKIKKEYIALVHNKMEQNEGEIKTEIKRSKDKGLFIACSEPAADSKKALTEYEVLEKFVNFTLLKVEILTGRTHQIRVHLASIGHSVVGDKLYKTHDVRVKKKGVDLGRLWLYAVKLGFKDLNNNQVEYEVKMPEELEEFLKNFK